MKSNFGRDSQTVGKSHFTAAALWLLAATLYLFTPQVANATTITVPRSNPDYVELFKAFDSNFNDGRGYSWLDNTTGSLAWGQSYIQLGYMRMYRATSDTLWLDKVVKHFDLALQKRDDRLGRVDFYAKEPLKAWGCSNYDPTGRWHVFVVHTGMICKAPAEFVRIVKSDPALQEKYGAKADAWLAELEEIVADANRNYRTTGTMGYYEDPSVGGGGIVPLNMSNAMGAVVVELYRITKKPEYKEQATQMANFFRANLHEGKQDQTWLWSYWPKYAGDPVKSGEDISHAAVNVDFAARCYQAGIVFSQRDMEKFANTWQLVVKDMSSNEPKYADYVDGVDKPDVNYNPQAAGRWLAVLPCLTPHQWRLYYAAIEPAFAGQEIVWPSQALGLSNLALYGAK